MIRLIGYPLFFFLSASFAGNEITPGYGVSQTFDLSPGLFATQVQVKPISRRPEVFIPPKASLRRGNLHIRWRGGAPLNLSRLEILDIQGRTLAHWGAARIGALKKGVSAEEWVLPMPERLPAGLSILRIEIAGQSPSSQITCAMMP
jgi:hypothetical protein